MSRPVDVEAQKRCSNITCPAGSVPIPKPLGGRYCNGGADCSESDLEAKCCMPFLNVSGPVFRPTDDELRLGIKAWLRDAESAEANLGPIGTWDTSQITDMSRLFAGSSTFNDDLSAWNTSGVTNMSSMFFGAIAYTGNDMSGWDTSLVTDMSSMFEWATDFAGLSIAGWDTSRVTDMSHMFAWSYVFKGDISKWNTSSVTDMSGMLYDAYSFDGDLQGWDTSKVTNMSHMFGEAAAFTGDISGWDTSRATDMSSMFLDCKLFSGDISKWNTSSVTDMSSMFKSAHKFNSNISGWDTSRVVDMNSMFASALAFNQDISSWKVCSVRNMSHMFCDAKGFSQRAGKDDSPLEALDRVWPMRVVPACARSERSLTRANVEACLSGGTAPGPISGSAVPAEKGAAADAGSGLILVGVIVGVVLLLTAVGLGVHRWRKYRRGEEEVAKLLQLQQAELPLLTTR